jgi:hypothetical protein
MSVFDYHPELIGAAENFCLAECPEFGMVCSLPPNHGGPEHIANCGATMRITLHWPNRTALDGGS